MTLRNLMFKTISMKLMKREKRNLILKKKERRSLLSSSQLKEGKNLSSSSPNQVKFRAKVTAIQKYQLLAPTKSRG